MTAGQLRLTGRIRIGLPPDDAFRLFTPRGEQEWAHGWHPHFPAPVPDDAEPGTVFETQSHGEHTIWVVTSRQPGQCISYARTTPGDRAGTVTVTITPAAGGSEAEIAYDLTALTAAAVPGLHEFGDGYPAYLRSWQDAIAYLVDAPRGAG
jgi:hypothetical protein